VCDFQMKCDILLIFHAGWTAAVMVDSYVDNFCSYSLDRLGRFHLKIAYAIGICSTWFHQGHKLKGGKESSFWIFLFLLFDSLLTCVVYLAFLKDLFVKCRRDIYLAELQSQLDSTPNKPEEEKQNPMNKRKSEWIQHNSRARGVWKGRLLKCRSQCQSILLYSQVYTVYPYTIEYKYS
jgi:hypothetical protein